MQTASKKVTTESSQHTDKAAPKKSVSAEISEANRLWHGLATHVGSNAVAGAGASTSVPSPIQRKPSHPTSAPQIQRACRECDKDMNTGPAIQIQTKLTVGAPDDPMEREADAVADKVMRMPEPKEKNTSQGKSSADLTTFGLLAGNSETSIQRQTESGQEDEGGVQIQLKATSKHTPQVTPNVAANIQSLQGGGQPLPANHRRFFESRMGHDFGGVRIHTDSKAADTAKSIQAKAFTLGNNIVFNAGQYSHDNQEGKKLLAHELTHVVQQSGERPKIQRQVQIDPFNASATHAVGLEPDMTAAFHAGLGSGAVNINAGVTRFAVNTTPYASADTIAQHLNLPLLSERDLRTIPQPNLRDPSLARVWSDERLLKKGKKGTAVRLIQQALKAWGRGKVVQNDPLQSYGDDGFFWDETLTAVLTFQTEWKGAGAPLEQDGLVGPFTLGALEAAMADLNMSEFWLNTAPNNHISGTINYILPSAAWSTISMMRSTLEAQAIAANFHTRSFSPCRRRDNPLTFSAKGPANLDQQVLAHEQIHEVDIGTAVRHNILPWYGAVTQLVTGGQRFRAASLAAAERLIYAEIGQRTAPVGGDPCSVGGALEVELVNLEFALHQLPGVTQFTGFTTNDPICNHAEANIDNLGRQRRPREVPKMACSPPLHMTISVHVPA